MVAIFKGSIYKYVYIYMIGDYKLLNILKIILELLYDKLKKYNNINLLQLK